MNNIYDEITSGKSQGPLARTSHGVPEVLQQQIKAAVHKELIKRLDLDRLSEFNQTRAGQQQLFSLILTDTMSSSRDALTLKTS